MLSASANGQRLAVAWTGGGITVHDLASGSVLNRFKGSTFAFSPDGQWIAVQEKSDIVLLPVAPGTRKRMGRAG